MGLAAATAACAPVIEHQGFQVVDVRPADVKVGTDTRTTVMAKLGTPTATSTFDKNVWFYMTQMRSQTGFSQAKTLSRNIVAISFDPATQQVKSVDTFTLKDGRVFAYNTRETPTRGREMTVLEQLLGSISAGSLIPAEEEQNPGQH